MGRLTATPVKAVMAACLATGLATLGGCSQPANCYGGDYRGGCVAGVAPPVMVSPYAAPTYAVPTNAAPVSAAPAGAAAAGVPLGDPATFADLDDKQCRSYGLAFGSHDYADCRIRLSAQHRGLDPNTGAVPASK